MSKRIKDAKELFENGSACSQAILVAFAEDVGIDKKLAHKLGTGLGAGLGRQQLVCGAINAGAIVISLKFGNETLAHLNKKEETYTLVSHYISKMKEQLGHINCIDLLGQEIISKEGQEKARANGLTEKVCQRCIQVVAEYLIKII